VSIYNGYNLAASQYYNSVSVCATNRLSPAVLSDYFFNSYGNIQSDVGTSASKETSQVEVNFARSKHCALKAYNV